MPPRKRKTSNPPTTDNEASKEVGPTNKKQKQTSLVLETVDLVVKVLEERGVIPKTGSVENSVEQVQQPSSSVTTTNSQPHSVGNQNLMTMVQDSIDQLPAIPGSIQAGPSAEYRAMSNSGINLGKLSDHAKEVLDNATSERTKTIYFNYWKHYMEFCKLQKLNVCLPIQETILINFLAHLLHQGYQVSTIMSHASALAYINKSFGYKDFSNCFFVKQFFKGAQNMSQQTAGDTRLPITYGILKQIIRALVNTIPNVYDRIMFKSMCILAFNGFLRMGELCTKGSKSRDKVLQFSDVKILEGDSTCYGVEICLKQFKHSKNQVTLFLPGNTQDSEMCPIISTKAFLSIIHHNAGPFFQLINGSAISYEFFSKHLRQVIAFLGYDTSKYKSHSFRIGAATYAVSQGHSEEAIKRMGRWKSNALQNYVRIPVLSLKTNG